MTLSAAYYCPHLLEVECPCRKPKPGPACLGRRGHPPRLERFRFHRRCCHRPAALGPLVASQSYSDRAFTIPLTKGSESRPRLPRKQLKIFSMLSSSVCDEVINPHELFYPAKCINRGTIRTGLSHQQTDRQIGQSLSGHMWHHIHHAFFSWLDFCARVVGVQTSKAVCFHVRRPESPPQSGRSVELESGMAFCYGLAPRALKAPQGHGTIDRWFGSMGYSDRTFLDTSRSWGRLRRSSHG